jgi:hypothetical protein
VQTSKKQSTDSLDFTITPESLENVRAVSATQAHY